MVRNPMAAPAVLLIAAFCTLTAAASPAQAAFGGQDGKIAFDRTSPSPQSSELHTINPDGAGDAVVSPNPSLYPAWSPGGTRIAFARGNRLMTTNADGSDPQTVLTWTGAVGAIDWSPAGQQLVAALQTCDVDNECRFDIYTMNVDGGALTDITPDAADDQNPSWAAGTSRIAFQSTRSGNADIYSVEPDGSDPLQLTTGSGPDLDPDWSPDGEQLLVTNGRSIYRIRADGTFLGSVTGGDAPSWAPDGSFLVFARSDASCVGREAIWTARYDGAATTQVTDPIQPSCVSSPTDGHPDWQPLPGSFVRPKGATPMRMPLVPAYRQCVAPNTAHGSPLAFPSCAPPAQGSGLLTVGTPDANGQPSVSNGYVQITVLPSFHDARIEVKITDVRRQDTLADYSGQVLLALKVRVTDGHGGAYGNEATTVSDAEGRLAFSCSATPDSTAGSICFSTFSFSSLFGGPTSRVVWEIDQIRVYDGGPDGNLATEGDNTLFATQGVFVP